MTTTFTASNGDTIETRPDGYLVVKDSHHTEWVSPLTADALREYFQHQRDEELGRWRDEHDPDMVVYPVQADPGTVMVIDEREGVAIPCRRDTFVQAAIEIGDDHTFPISDYDRAAARYFAAHPEPKPWHDAEAGTFWRVHPKYTGATGRLAIAHGDDTFTDECGIGWTAKEITDATRLHPAESRDE